MQVDAAQHLQFHLIVGNADVLWWKGMVVRVESTVWSNARGVPCCGMIY